MACEAPTFIFHLSPLFPFLLTLLYGFIVIQNKYFLPTHGPYQTKSLFSLHTTRWSKQNTLFCSSYSPPSKPSLQAAPPLFIPIAKYFVLQCTQKHQQPSMPSSSPLSLPQYHVYNTLTPAPTPKSTTVCPSVRPPPWSSPTT